MLLPKLLFYAMVLLLGVCGGRQTWGQKGDTRMEFTTRTLLTRYGPPPQELQQPTLTIFHSAAAWQRFVNTHNGQGEALAQIALEWATSVILLIRTLPEGGMDLYPGISLLRREGNMVEIQVEMLRQPHATALDIEVQPWLIAAAPQQAFAGTPQIRFAVKGQPDGTVSHER
jgi:hypothetical protein